MDNNKTWNVGYDEHRLRFNIKMGFNIARTYYMNTTKGLGHISYTEPSNPWPPIATFNLKDIMFIIKKV